MRKYIRIWARKLIVHLLPPNKNLGHSLESIIARRKRRWEKKGRVVPVLIVGDQD